MNRQVRRIPRADAGQKIVSVNNAMGVKGIGNMQGTTRTIYDAVQLSTSANSNTLTLFENCKTRTFPLTNLTENKLQVGESLALQRWTFYLIECTSGTTNAIGVLPLAYFAALQRMYASTYDLFIAQDTVIKKQPLSALFAPFNKDANFMGGAYFQETTNAGTTFPYPHDVCWFDNNIIIPPQIEFKVQITIPPITLPSGFDFYLACSLEGLGSLYAPKSTY